MYIKYSRERDHTAFGVLGQNVGVHRLSALGQGVTRSYQTTSPGCETIIQHWTEVRLEHKG